MILDISQCNNKLRMRKQTYSCQFDIWSHFGGLYELGDLAVWI